MNAFDRVLWRINGVLVLAGCLGIALVALYVFYPSAFFTADRNPEALWVEAGDDFEKSYLHLGDGSLLAGVPVLRCPLYDSEPSGKRLRYSRQREIRNYLFIDSTSLKSWWLLPDDSAFIVGHHDLFKPRGGDGKTVVSTLYQVALEDSNGDGRIDADDRVSVLFSTNRDAPPVNLTGDSKKILSIYQVSDSEALIMVQTDDGAEALVIQIESGKRVRESSIALRR